MRFKKAFTMAEAIIVMTILGIIATIMISTMKPTEFRDRGFAVLAKKVLGQVDAATTQIIFNNAWNSSMANLYNPTNASLQYSFSSNCAWTMDYYKKYLVGTREAVAGAHCKKGTTSMMLKDGSCLGFGAAAANSWIPGESASVAKVTTGDKTEIGAIYIDLNDDDEPNIYGKDQYILPISKDGIAY